MLIAFVYRKGKKRKMKPEVFSAYKTEATASAKRKMKREGFSDSNTEATALATKFSLTQINFSLVQRPNIWITISLSLFKFGVKQNL